MTLRIPPELQDQIIDHLHNDRHALTTCALVCREWRVSSQFQLFRSASVTHPRPLSQFNTFLAAAPHLRGIIRELVLCGSARGQSVAQMVVTENEVVACVEKLPNLRALTLDALWLAPSYHNPAVPEPTPLHLRSLRVLKVFTSPHTLFDTIASFPGVRFLGIEDVRPTLMMSRRSPARNTPPPPIETLSLTSTSSTSLLQYFLPGPQQRLPLSSLSALSLDLEELQPCYELRELVQAVSPHLQSLRMSFGKGVTVNEASKVHLKSLALASLENLRSCTLDFSEADPQVLLVFILRELTSTLEDLTLICPGTPPTNVDKMLGSRRPRRLTVLPVKGELSPA